MARSTLGKSSAGRSSATGSTMAEMLRAQRQYVEDLNARGDSFGLMVAGAFVRGIRDIGYRHTGTALDEIIDNAFQALASQVHVIFDHAGGSDKKPDKIAVLDDGHGMEPGMLRAAIRWGGTHREDDRSGWGRYGYGMKSAAVSQGRCFTVYSRVEEGGWHRITLDLDDIAEGRYNDRSGEIRVPMPEPATLPPWVKKYMKQQLGKTDLDHGTVVVLGKLDRLSYKTTQRLKILFVDHFGVTYRNTLRTQSLYVDGKRIEPVDPLFTTPGMWLYDLDEDRADGYDPDVIEVKDRDTGESAGMIRVRYSYMLPTFQSTNKQRGGPPLNPRFSIMKAHRGIVVMRNGRQIDVVDSRCPWTTFVNYDRNWGIEVDFPATLDEEFSITTSKQQVVLSDRMWEILDQAGVREMIRKLRKRFKEDKARLAAEQDEKPDGKRPSEEAMEDAQRFKRRPQESAEQEKKNRERLKEEVRKRAKQSGMPEPDVERQLVAELAGQPYRVELESAPGGVFFRVEKIGGQLVLYLNTAHRFYQDFYAGPGSNPWVRGGLEVLLFTLGEAEIYAEGDRRMFYETERAVWSRDLSIGLDRLSELDSVDDALSATDELEAPEEELVGAD